MQRAHVIAIIVRAGCDVRLVKPPSNWKIHTPSGRGKLVEQSTERDKGPDVKGPCNHDYCAGGVRREVGQTSTKLGSSNAI